MQLQLRRVDIALLLALAACATPKAKHGAQPGAVAAVGSPKIGKPYQVFGIWYYPADTRDYDQRGIASWYGPGFHALSTANGERYDQDDVTAAHKTLPMPSYVEVENLENGRKLTVRVNDRGPFVAGRIIDLSRRSAQLLGVDRAGTAKVRVRRVYPGGAVIAGLAPTAQTPPPPIAVPIPAVPAMPGEGAVPAVAVMPLPPVQATGLAGAHAIQVAALADPGRIAWLAGYLSSFGTVMRVPGPSGLTRIRLGPYADAGAANAVLAQLRAAGYSDARLVAARLVAATPIP